MSERGDTGGGQGDQSGQGDHRAAADDLAGRLDDPDYPAYTTGQAAAALGVRQAFLRSLDAARAVRPQRSAGGHRRYSRRQLLFAQRIRELFDQGHTLTSAQRILSLEDELAAARALIGRLRGQLDHRAGAAGQAGPRDAPEADRS
jgi:MerR family transcriptional regulator, heat shock protein HspR